MKPTLTRIMIVIFFVLAGMRPTPAAQAQEVTPTSPPQVLPTSPANRPVVLITSYYLDKDSIRPGDSFSLFLTVRNDGQSTARNPIFSFTSDAFLPRETGGVIAIAPNPLPPGGTSELRQPLLADVSLWGKTNGTLTVNLSYTDEEGVPFSENFTITLEVLGWSGVVSSTATPTPTATIMSRAQLVVGSYSTDVDPLQPGSMFGINLEVKNLGATDARNVTMILGGGSFGTTGESTPEPGGVSGGSSDLSVFAPIGSSNLQYLGDLAPGGTLQASQKLIVNVSANPGAYALKLSFAYTDLRGNHLVDDQIITLLVYQLPQLDVNFYRDPGPISAMTPNTLPIQVVNLGRKPAVMGNMTVTAENAELMNNVSLVGTLDTGGYFPLDVMLIPQAAGPMDVTVTINYTDDFNTPRTFTKTLTVDVMEAMPIDPGFDPSLGPDGQPLPDPGVIDQPVDENFWQKVVRFLKGLFGLDSAPAGPEVPPESFPMEEMPGGGGGSTPAQEGLG